MVIFTHLDQGTPEDVWQSDERIRTVPMLDAAIDELIVVAAHPDDETLGAGGLIRRVHERGGKVTVVVATDGEASHPQSTSHSPRDLAAIRRREVKRAVRVLDPDADVRFLGLPDGALRENSVVLEEELARILDSTSAPAHRRLIVAPWSGDGHRDHRVAAASVSRVASTRAIPHLAYPIWLWHWGRPDDVPWDSSLVLSLTPGERATKARALQAHVSQTQPLSDAPGDEAVLPESMQAHFERGTELYVVEPRIDAQTLTADWFEDFYARHADPWGFETRWYEERKRALVMACLPDQRLGNVLEIGCSTGLITLELAERADHVLGVDASAAALDAARARFGERPGVTLRQGAIPEQWPDGAFDTVVFSEVGYYLSRTDLDRAVALIQSAVTAEGCVVACHWRHPVAEYPLSGDEVHRALRAVESWETLVLHEEEDFVLEVFCPKPAQSVARREGLR